MGKTSLLGYTGFVGTTLTQQTQFDDLYNSKNINELKGKEYDLIVCAAAPAVKWKANQNAEEDLNNLQLLMNSLKEVKAEFFVLISTVDVYKNPYNVDEDTIIIPKELEPYGKHRFYLEQFIKEHFSKHLIIRLPGLFGDGLKKNFIYDLINNNRFDLTHKDSSFQFYNMINLWSDIQIAFKNNDSLVNFNSEPVTAFEIAEYALGLEFNNITEKSPVYYNMESKYAKNYGGDNRYFKNKSEILEEIKQFIKVQQSGLS
ncbi:sugar nucleotide-binding protein [Paenibacillus sp. PK4536]|uniref:NAD-dependent epimerase/dehydratase family protein n=1 Tax=Paenibacillus sp. PK4536 TaxID=3024576 RepID=UPI00235951A8|nr:NAD-dependent epimerase/dehydratase family protein [Paenibacillus sp. PK4536]WIM39758.1 sugar nucleotide-binding protein [Paenibacillus sp. PK4536]